MVDHVARDDGVLAARHDVHADVAGRMPWRVFQVPLVRQPMIDLDGRNHACCRTACRSAANSSAGSMEKSPPSTTRVIFASPTCQTFNLSADPLATAVSSNAQHTRGICKSPPICWDMLWRIYRN